MKNPDAEGAWRVALGAGDEGRRFSSDLAGGGQARAPGISVPQRNQGGHSRAYRGHAAEACQREARSQAPGLTAQAWASPAAIELLIGKAGVDVNLWQVDNALWNVRYRNPYLVLTAHQNAGAIYCEYDILNAAARVHRM